MTSDSLAFVAAYLRLRRLQRQIATVMARHKVEL